MAPAQPVQIIASSEDETPGAENATFYLKEKALAEILNKVPKDMLVSVVSVVGAFRTGKSFLLTLFLRYLRARSEHSSSGGGNGDWDNDVENWLHAEGDSVLEGNNNKRGGGGGGGGDNDEDPTSSSTSAAAGSGGFAWRGGQERMTTGIWMWSEPFTHYCAAAGKEVAVLLMDTQGMFDNETTMNLTAQIFGISTLVSSFQIYNVQNSIGEDKLMHLALFSEYVPPFIPLFSILSLSAPLLLHAMP
jgi:atlastin